MGKITVVRRVVQVGMLALFCLPPLLAGWGLAGLFAGGDGEVAAPAEGILFGSLSSSDVAGVTLLDPLATLEAMAASRSLLTASALVGALLVVLVYGLVRGRAFCAWVCPVNLIGEGVDAVRRRVGIAVPERTVDRRAKIAVAAAVVAASTLVGFPVFEAVSPIGAVNKGLAFGGFAGAGTLVAIVIAELLVSRRVWCRALCPLGGVFQVLGRVGQVNVAIDHDACIHCDKCAEACLADPAILTPVLAGEDAIVRAGDCMACGACVDACPAAALRFRLGRPRGASRGKADSAPVAARPSSR
ncbi:4Fe-4S binding protein [Adlercreutzia sp. R21]|uniref:4Fe-4S binding protein n=1 Tax=Adlercreutzia wanghongyangiae TaxID=3111451 RepID=UPI002DBB8167|nr:4Fe-4S binding protein [Adlercreutzia sp. R21]MEC4183874.1 4Fe-4S binding protein [Adlercreutzia sp. R21]